MKERTKELCSLLMLASERLQMAEDLLHAIQCQLANYAVGILKRVEGAGSTVIGSGVLVNIDGRKGILTCGHVVEQYSDLAEIGVVRFSSGSDQSQTADILDAHHLIVRSSDEWTEMDLDLGFTYLSPPAAEKLEQKSVFLNLEINRNKIENMQLSDYRSVDVVFGLIHEYSGEPFIEHLKFISPLRAVIYRGVMYSDDNCLIRFKTIDSDPGSLPANFGGLSGSGLWRIYYKDRGEGRFEIVDRQLWGITSWQVDKQENKGALIGQSWDRIDQELILEVRKNLRI